MKLALALLFVGLSSAAEPWPLDRLFSRPFAWGAKPEKLRWSKQGHTLLFLWNAEGNRFKDLYAYHPDKQKLIRLTKLESIKDDLNRTPAEKDDRRKLYLAPPAGLEEFDLSQDGARAAFAYKGDLYTVLTDGSQPAFRLTKTKSAELLPQLSPDGHKLAFVREEQLVVQDLRNGQLSQVTDIEGESTSLHLFHWSPDGRRFLYVARSGRRRLNLPNYSGRLVTNQLFARTLAGDEPVDTKTYVIAAEGGDARAMDSGPWGVKVYSEDPEWSPDSKYILQSLQHPHQKQQQLVVQDASTGKAKVIYEESDPAWVEAIFAGWSPDSRTVFFTSDKDGWTHIYKIARDGGAAQQLTRGPWEIHKEPFSVDPQWIGDYIYYSSTEDGTSERHFYRIRQDGTAKEKLSAREGLHIGLVSEDGRHTAMLETDEQNPFDLYVNGKRVTTSPRPNFFQYAWPQTHLVNFPSRGDGKMVAARILLPPGYRPEDRAQKPRPAIFFIHGSGYATSVLKQWGSYVDLRYVFNCYLANKGYVVMDIDYRGSSGYGRQWRTDIYLHLGGRDLEDVLGGVDYLRGLGNIDMQRIGIWGSSYGGFMTNMAMFLSPGTFRAGVAFSAVNDWENYNAHYTEQRLNKPQQYPEAYRRSSPIHFSAGLKNPLLIVHGMIDDNVLFQDAVQLAEKLIHEGKDFSHIYYPEESHSFVRDETLIDAFRRTAEFFDRCLQ